MAKTMMTTTTTNSKSTSTIILITQITIIFIAFALGRLSITVLAPLTTVATTIITARIPPIDTTTTTNTTTTTTKHKIEYDDDTRHEEHHTVLITGATGRTGSLLYSILATQQQQQNQPKITLRALVRNVTRAREVLHCTHCDERDGIFIGDVTQPADLHRAARGADTLVVLAGSGPGTTPEEQRAVEYDGVVESVRALAQPENRDGGSGRLRVVLCSSMGTTTPGGGFLGDVLFWKLNAEAFLGASGIGAVVVKPCGLTDGAGGNATLLVGHRDSIAVNGDGNRYPVARGDVAAVMARAVVSRRRGLRFDLCSEPGPATVDLDGLLEEARWEWDR